AEPASFSEWSTFLAETISDAGPDAFTPPLAEIDSLINSIQANLPRPKMEFDLDGKVELTIVSPKDQGETLLGRPLQIEGYVQPGPEKEVELLLVANNNNLAGETVRSDLDGWWEASLDIPQNLQGEVELIVVANNQTARVSVELKPDPTSEQSSFSIIRPQPNEMSFAGYPIFLEGILANQILVDDSLTVQLRVNECKTPISSQTLTLLPTDRYWYAELLVPEQISNDGCIVAVTGSYGQPGWREIQIQTQFKNVDPSTLGEPIVQIGNSLLTPLIVDISSPIFGVVVGNLEEGDEINLSFQDREGDILETGTASIDPATGRWSYPFQPPKGTTGRIFIQANVNGNLNTQTHLSLPTHSP
ncbi:MAG: hypothetical protein AAGD96_29855, partial [Chloroflexota bacterium]